MILEHFIVSSKRKLLLISSQAHTHTHTHTALTEEVLGTRLHVIELYFYLADAIFKYLVMGIGPLSLFTMTGTSQKALRMCPHECSGDKRLGFEYE